MRKYAAEIIGTFILVFVGTGSVVVNDVTGGVVSLVGVGLTWGLIVMAMVYTLGDVSGAHLNPAVTCGFWFARRFPGRRVAPYLGCQIVGALLASALIRVLFREHPSLAITQPRGTEMQSFVLEVVMTAILVFVVMNVSTGPKEIGLMAGIAVGGVIAFEVIFAGPISGASMNPARSIGPAVVSGRLQHLWVYLVAPIVGSAVGVGGWRGVRGNEEGTGGNAGNAGTEGKAGSN